MLLTTLLPSVLSADPSLLVGAQRPRLHRAPEYVSSAGQEAIECAALAGLNLDPWEQLVLVDALGERADGRWSAFEVGLEAPRQNGKGSVLEARELAGLFAFGERLLIHSAHEQVTSSEHFRRILNLIEGVPEFDQRVLKVVKGKGSEAVELRGDQRILFKTRTGGGGRGLSGDFVGLDEAMILPVATVAALVPVMAARSMSGNPQLWYCGSAVDRLKHEHGLVFTLVRERALSGSRGVAYFGFSADVKRWLDARGLTFDPERSEIEQVTPEMLADPEMWAQANPGLGIRISQEHIALEQGGALGPREFAVERLGIADPPETTEPGRVISAEEWIRCAEHDRANRIVSKWVISVDTNTDQTWGSVGIAGERADGFRQVALTHRERGTDWIVDHCVDLSDAYGGVGVVVDKRGPAANLIQPLKDASLRVIEVSTQEYGDACADFVADVASARVKYPSPQPELTDAVAAGRKQSMGDRWKWSRRASTSADISPLVAVTLARWAVGIDLEEQPVSREWMMF